MMNTIYKVTSLGGCEKRDYRVDYYDTEENARNRIATDNWNECFHLYEVVVTVNEKGLLVAKEKEIEL